MTTVSEPEGEARRKRYARGAPQHGMTATKQRLLAYVAECGMLTTSQVARIAGIGTEAAYKHLRHLFDLGMLERIAVPYASLAPPGEDGPELAFGPGQNVHVPTKAALQYLHRAGLISDETAARKPPDYGPRNALFLAHEVLVRDVRVWLEVCARTHGGYVERWVDGTAAHLPPARPDAWFMFRLADGERTLVGLVEADRDTERRDRWDKKGREYAQMLAGETLAQATDGRRKGRLLAVAPDGKRRDWIANALAGSPIADVSFCASRDDLLGGGLNAPVWRVPAAPNLTPLLPPSLLSSAMTGDTEQRLQR